MFLADMNKIKSHFHRLGKYKYLLSKYEKNQSDYSIIFEMVFAYWFENFDISLEYEKNVNSENDKSVDFTALINGIYYNMELVRIEDSEELTRQTKDKTSHNKYLEIHEVILSSHSDKKYLRTAAQLIRLQEKVLDKVEKFGKFSAQAISIIVADCTNIHMGMLDDEDVRMVAYGKTKNKIWQEYWDNRRLQGLFDPSFAARNAELLRQRMTAIIFIPELNLDILRKGYLAINPALNIECDLQSVAVFSGLIKVMPAL